jgi:hypothetical protein
MMMTLRGRSPPFCSIVHDAFRALSVLVFFNLRRSWYISTKDLLAHQMTLAQHHFHDPTADVSPERIAQRQKF